MITRRIFVTGLLGLGAVGGAVAVAGPPQWRRAALQYVSAPTASQPPPADRLFARPEPWAVRLIAGAENQIGKTLWYDPAYMRIGYPGGDVPIDRGVCTDVVIRAYRNGLGIDLQKLVHEDMARDFAAYPKAWGLAKPDPNIDHRRVPNLQVFFSRRKAALPVTEVAADYLPGDVITMKLPGGAPHIALITERANGDGARPMCIHNIGAGARLDDVLFVFKLSGHYRFKIS